MLMAASCAAGLPPLPTPTCAGGAPPLLAASCGLSHGAFSVPAYSPYLAHQVAASALSSSNTLSLIDTFLVLLFKVASRFRRHLSTWLESNHRVW